MAMSYGAFISTSAIVGFGGNAALSAWIAMADTEYLRRHLCGLHRLWQATRKIGHNPMP